MDDEFFHESRPVFAPQEAGGKQEVGLPSGDDAPPDHHETEQEQQGHQDVESEVLACIGIGLGEDTGMLITGGNRMQAIGSGLVMIIDGHEIVHSNIADIPDGNPISIENLKVHFCEHGNGYLIKERHFLMEAGNGSLIKKQVDVE